MTLLSLSSSAGAFEIYSPISESCHEDLAMGGAQLAGFPEFSAAPAATEDQRRAMDDLVFVLPHGDAWTLALLIGVRSNDVGENAPTNIDGLIHLHDNPDDQAAHCIRRPEDDGPEGDVGALGACRQFIIDQLQAGGLLEEQLDLTRSEGVTTFFRFRGSYEIQLPKFAYRLGRAAHAVQDGYAHTMRDAASGRVVHVLNWIDAFGQSDYVEATDGYQHLSGLDDCRRKDAHQALRVDRAAASTGEIFAAIRDPAPNRRQRVEAAVDAALALMPGCDATNQYCNAPELSETKDLRSFGCSAMGGSGSLVLAGIALLGLRRRRRVAGAAVVGLLVIGGLHATPAYAQEPVPEPTPAPGTEAPLPQPEPTNPAAAPPPEQEPTGPQATALARVDASDRWHRDHWHFDLRLGGAIDDAAAAVMAGVARTQGRWTAGFIAEWNPWFSFDKVSVRAGVINAYLALGYRWFQGTRLTLSTRIEAGSSTMLFELLGIDKYTTGLYLGGALVSVRFPLTPRVALTFDPVHFGFPTPRPFGLPFYYKQYRVSFGVELNL
ncbi:MAG: hypothetical protein WKG01_13855 [Kofleriaceae bacterium]